MKLLRRAAEKGKKRTFAFGTGFFLIACCAQAFCCGGGYVPLPYIPTSSGNINTPSTRSSFFLIEKGSASELFDVKKLHPLFRNIHQSGNERKLRVTARSAKADSSATASRDSTAADSARALKTIPKSAPVLNLHSIH